MRPGQPNERVSKKTSDFSQSSKWNKNTAHYEKQQHRVKENSHKGVTHLSTVVKFATQTTVKRTLNFFGTLQRPEWLCSNP
jgi:hypothetical protein